MRLLLQRVKEARVDVDGEIVGKIGQGLLVFVGLGDEDDESHLRPAAEKIVNLRIFADENLNMNKSVADVSGGILVVSQFTLWADARKGRRPSYIHAMHPSKAEPMCDQFVTILREIYDGGPIETGRFGAMMDVHLINDGPVTIWLDSAEMGWGK